jgi:sulfoquinovosidase
MSANPCAHWPSKLFFIAILVGSGCGDNIHPVVISQGAVTIEVENTGPQIRILRGDATIWTTQRGGALTPDGAPLTFAAVGVDSAKVEELFGSFRFRDELRSQRWTNVDELRNVVVRPDNKGITFDLHGDGHDLGTGEALFVTPAAPAKPYIQIALSAPDYGRISLGATCTSGEHFVGLGGQSFDVDHRGQTVPLWVQEDGIGKDEVADDEYLGAWFFSGRRHSTHTPMPMALSSRGYATVIDSDARTIVALCSEREDLARFETWNSTFTMNLFIADDLNDDTTAVASSVAVHDALHQMLSWVGKPAPASQLMFAPWLDAIFGDSNVKRVADRLRSEGIAASALWTEDFRGGVQGALGYELDEDWRSDPVLYPNISQLTSRLHGQGLAFLTYSNTFMDSKADIYTEGTTSGFCIHDSTGAPYLFDGVTFRKTTMLDLSSVTAVNWAKGVLSEMLRDGADGWMADYAEWLPYDAKLASGRSAKLDHNAYPVQWAKLNYELLGPPSNPQRDRLYFMRSAWLRSQPFVQTLWAGDQQTDFNKGDGMQSVIPMGLGLGVTGFPYFAHDIGGYVTQGEGVVPTTRELYFRWVTFGALSPGMRTHHGRDAKSNYQWENDAEAIAHMRRWTRFHMQLVPYLMGASATYQTDSDPIFRLIALDFPQEQWAWSARDQYLLGDRILVAPVMTAGATSRSVMLPTGTWLPLLGGAAQQGGATAVTIASPLAEIPAFVPQGALLVLWPDGVETVLAAPSSPTTKTAATVGADRDVIVWPGQASGATARVAQWNDNSGASRQATAQWRWTGRALTASAPTSATFNGGNVAVTTEGRDTVVRIVGDGTLSFAGGGELIIARGQANAKVTVRLRQ